MDFAEEEKEEDFRRFVMFVFKNRDENKPMAPWYIVFYSKPEYVAFKKQIKHLFRGVSLLENKQFFIYQRYPWPVQNHLSMKSR